ncbi:phakinin isoform X2 [Gymnodraco acuticeps]|uniref:Phakinin isoform X2 n=1 Tax=Gymnodraco acuticeps TaxID=8218 RepID=A0A6P8V5T9_GYMAC|nr:phakinin isoform X2 [Gymnodraco acuticeps]
MQQDGSTELQDNHQEQKAGHISRTSLSHKSPGFRAGGGLFAMPLPRRRSSFLGAPSCERPPRGVPGTLSGVYGTPLSVSAPPGLSTRVSRRALGISSVFLQGLRSSAAPVMPGGSGGPYGGSGGSCGGGAGLNGCLMEYRDKVRALETLNLQLEDGIRLALDRKTSSAGAWEEKRREWEEVYRQVSEAILDNARLMLQTENVQANAEDFKERFESEQPFRTLVQDEIFSLHKVIQEAGLSRAELQEQLESMREELQHLEQDHQQDVRSLYAQMSGRELDQPNAPIRTSLDRILSHIRSHWEALTERNRAETDCYLDGKEAQCVSLSPEEQQVEALKAECSDTCCQIQNLQAESESIRALRRGLQSSLSDAQHWQQVEQQNRASVVLQLQAELSELQEEIQQQRRLYDTLLSNKQRLERDVGVYHGVLDGEESRFTPSALSARGRLQD